MKRLILLFLHLFTFSAAYAQPANDKYENATGVDPTKCSADRAFTTVNSADENFFGTADKWNPGQTYRDVWFKFTAAAYDIDITVTGNSTGGGTTGGTLLNPLIALYTIDVSGTTTSFSNQIGSLIKGGTISTFYKGALTVGKVYYIRVSAENNNTGTFKLCINNYFSPLKAGQDLSTASLLCDKRAFTESNVSGTGTSNTESAGSCLGTESNSVWYKWVAKTSGTLTMDITPTVNTDDIDWIIYDLGTSGDINNKTLLRCAVGHGVSNTGCPNDPLYFKTGMNLTSTEVDELSGCGRGGQDGYVKAIDMVAGHTYALLVDNFSNGNNGFKIEFGGSGEFEGPSGKINMIKNLPCTSAQSYTFTAMGSANYTNIEWSFGEGASIAKSTSLTPPTVTYSTPGFKSVVLQVFNADGCSVGLVESFFVGSTPDKPILTSNQPDFCVSDTIRLSAQAQDGVTYKWTGPNNFTSDLLSIEIPATSTAVAGTYTLLVSRGDCIAPPGIINVTPIFNKPVAAFRSDPSAPAKLAFPVTVKFFNESIDADTYLWDFGDGQTSTDVNPEHTYAGRGNFDVTLTASKSNACSVSIMKGTFMVGEPGSIFIPNTFTPNNDAANDEFVINMSNIKTYNIQIFNRYGILMYSSVDLSQTWDGTYENKPVPVGTYYYVLDAVDLDNNIIKKSGPVTILR